MIIYMPNPEELLYNMEFRELIQIKLPSGGYVNAESLAYNKMRVVEIVSTDPMDYMYEQYQPGNIITL
jgi:hypothetical protein